MSNPAIFLPGIIMPAELAYADLWAALGTERPIVLRDLAIYQHDSPITGYGLDHEVEAIKSTAAEHGFDEFHLVGYSAGGAAAVAFAAKYGTRLTSLTLLEPAWLGNSGMSDAERRTFEEEMSAAALSGPLAMAKFAKLNLAEGVEPPAPPPGDPPPWMSKRPAAIRAIGPAFLDYELDIGRLQELSCPVLYVLGTLSAKIYEERAHRARDIFADYTLEIFEGRHHFEPPHRTEVERMAPLLREFWSRAE